MHTRGNFISMCVHTYDRLSIDRFCIDKRYLNGGENQLPVFYWLDHYVQGTLMYGVFSPHATHDRHDTILDVVLSITTYYIPVVTYHINGHWTCTRHYWLYLHWFSSYQTVPASNLRRRGRALYRLKKWRYMIHIWIHTTEIIGSLFPTTHCAQMFPTLKPFTTSKLVCSSRIPRLFGSSNDCWWKNLRG